jgi:CDP-glycerol glycerophosphotransferase (TagB/SpsB family)
LKARYRHLHFSVPELRVSSSFDISGSETTALASLLKHSDVVVNCFSTINLEAAIFDRPIVNVAFNGTGRTLSANRRHDLAIDEAQSHNQRVVKSGAVRIARSPDELLRCIDENLLAPGADAESRRRLVETECGGYMGEAGRRIADLILAQVHGVGRTPADAANAQDQGGNLHEVRIRA